MSAPKSAPPPAAAKPCPVCRKPAQPRFRPFCSARCQTIDLARWIGGNYRVPVVEEDGSSVDEEDA
ncbi:MAG TPA: DNA gyrase inhibitor YacG [Stellaceae bacterium]